MRDKIAEAMHKKRTKICVFMSQSTENDIIVQNTCSNIYLFHGNLCLYFNKKNACYRKIFIKSPAIVNYNRLCNRMLLYQFLSLDYHFVFYINRINK